MYFYIICIYTYIYIYLYWKGYIYHIISYIHTYSYGRTVYKSGDGTGTCLGQPSHATCSNTRHHRRTLASAHALKAFTAVASWVFAQKNMFRVSAQRHPSRGTLEQGKVCKNISIYIYMYTYIYTYIYIYIYIHT